MTQRLEDFLKRQPVAEITQFGERPMRDPLVSSGPYRVGTAERRAVAEADGHGYEELVHVSDGLYLLLCNRLSHKAQSANFVGEGVLKMHFRLTGHSTILLPGGVSVNVEGAYCGVMLHPTGLDKGEIDHPDVAERWATIFCRSEFLRDSVGVEIDAMPLPLRRFVSGESYSLYNQALPLTPLMSHALAGMLDSRMTGAIRNLQVEGRCLDLVSQVLDIIRNSHGLESLQRLTMRDAECIRHAREILEREYASPPTLNKLARRVGINQNKLNFGFRSLFGITAGEFVTECRMRHAHLLLEQGGMMVAQVAYAVGYEFPGNFTTAYKRYFGVPPRSTQKLHPRAVPK